MSSESLKAVDVHEYNLGLEHLPSRWQQEGNSADEHKTSEVLIVETWNHDPWIVGELEQVTRTTGPK